jgi:hypothetical protein
MKIQPVKTYKLTKLLVVLALLLLTPALAFASTVIRTGDTVSIGQDQVIEGDLYAAGNIVSLSGQVEEDLLVAGTEVNINGQVGLDVFALGANVDINGTVGDDLRVIGSNVIVAEPILGDVFAVGANIKILSTASVSGDVTVIGGTVIIEAPVEGDILGWVESLRIDSSVTGDINVTTQSLTLGDKATISGNVQYVSSEPLVRSQSSTIVGEEVRNDPPIADNESFNPLAILLPLLGLLFSVALWFLVSRRSLQLVVSRTLLPGVRAVLLGGATLLLAPFAIVVLVMSALGTLPGLALLTLYVLFIILAMIALPAVAAQLVLTVVKGKQPPVSLLTLIIGVGLVGLASITPLIGPILLVGFFILTFGALVDLLLRTNR